MVEFSTASTRSCSSAPMSVSMQLNLGRHAPQTSQPPWSASTRAAGLPRSCGLGSTSTYFIERERSVVSAEKLSTPASAGAWEEWQRKELKSCCQNLLKASSMPDNSGHRRTRISCRNLGDFSGIHEPQPRPIRVTSMTALSGCPEQGRRKLQG